MLTLLKGALGAHCLCLSECVGVFETGIKRTLNGAGHSNTT